MIKVHLRALSRRIATDEPTRRMLAVAGYLAFTLLLPLVFHDLAPMLLLPAGAAVLYAVTRFADRDGGTRVRRWLILTVSLGSGGCCCSGHRRAGSRSGGRSPCSR